MARWGVGGEVGGAEEVGGEIREDGRSYWNLGEQRLGLKGASCNKELLTTCGFRGRIRDAEGENAFFQWQFALK